VGLDERQPCADALKAHMAVLLIVEDKVTTLCEVKRRCNPPDRQLACADEFTYSLGSTGTAKELTVDAADGLSVVSE
jgi:hypothetical protein